MGKSKLIPRTALLVLLAITCWGQQRAAFETKSIPETGATQPAEQNLGPFTIAGQSFTIALENQRIARATAGAFVQTLERLEVRDQGGHVLYQKTFPYKLQGDRFQEVVTASARLLPGDNLTGLLITYTRQPAAPGSEQSWQVFGFRDGKLALFDPPGPEPAMTAPPGFAGVVMVTPNGPRTMPTPMRGPLDTVELRAWTGNFFVILPLRVDWRAGKLLPGERCLESGGGPGLHEVGCDMRAEANRLPGTADLQFARIFPTAEEQAGMSVQHAVIPRGAEVQVLKAKSVATWMMDGDLMRVQFRDLWLKVLVNNNTDNEGWIHGEQDLAAIGLPARSPYP